MDHQSPHYLLVDDHSLIREGMMHAIRSLQPAARFSQANTCRGALSHLANSAADPIDAVLLDLGLPDSSGVDTLKHVRQVATTQRIGIITGSTDAQLALECIHHGASCFIPKLGELDGFMTALQALVEGRLHFPADLLSSPAATLPDSPDLLPSIKLTPRQKDVLTWITRGCSNPVIATALGISPETVKLHVSAIFRAYKVHSRTQLVLLCSRQAPVEEQLP
ncbi:MAG: response regulator transcription factor [Aquabacterium sp.]|uniref:LuxR C-terminal-related transcriptional regulator n=1 Tax=Aquabacterium sp. TaxID=1872578 RepID=UPI00271AB552|nr:response regulator transcription factor [Aquabacterium sp.]MDO9002249.1 response regulator transcription factor [Aquabacterium sp.]